MLSVKIDNSINITKMMSSSQMIGNHKKNFEIKGETSRCDEIISLREHSLIGISPFNSRFSREYVNALVDWAAAHFDAIDVLLPCEEEAARLLVAAGSPLSKAHKKTRREIERHLNILEPIIERYRTLNRPIRVFQFSDMKDNQAYQKKRARVEAAFETNQSFREACLEMSRQAVGGRVKGTGGSACAIDEEQVHLALPYIFAEIPFYVNTPALLSLKHSVLIYHRPWPIGTGLFAGRYPLRVHPSQGYGVVTQQV